MSLTLPTELLAQVVAFAVPPPSPDPTALQLRYDLLLACSQANSTLRAIAQEHLFTHVRLRNHKAFDSFSFAINGAQRALGDKVVQLCVGDVESGRVGGDRDELAELANLREALAYCPNIQDLIICDLELAVTDLDLFHSTCRHRNTALRNWPS
jgi:hypothetical protein